MATLLFPQDFPYNPPDFYFKRPLYHPNVYNDGRLCISILHPPGDDPTSGETAAERWNPTQSVESILLSVVSLLADPNPSSPANVDAGVCKTAFSPCTALTNSIRLFSVKTGPFSNQ